MGDSDTNDFQAPRVGCLPEISLDLALLHMWEVLEEWQIRKSKVSVSSQ
jgi:hypothetical protein